MSEGRAVGYSGRSTDVGVCYRTNATRMNGECGHVFCGICVTQGWGKHVEEANAEGMAAWRAYQCATCRGETSALVGRGLRTRENMPFRVDGVMERLITVMCEQGKKLGAEIEGLKVGGTSGDGDGEWEEMEGRWRGGGEVVEEREYGLQASVDAMARFERYWTNLESGEIIGRLGLFRGIDGGERRTVPKSPGRRRGGGGGRIQTRPRQRVVTRMRQGTLFEYDSDVQIVAGPSTSNAGGRGRGRARERRRDGGDREHEPLAVSSDVEIVSD